MNEIEKTAIAMALVSALAVGSYGQPSDLMANQQRFDFRDLGQKGSNLVEPDDSRITSLALDPGTGRIYGATSGKRAQIFAFEPSTNHLRPLGVLPAAEGVRNAVAVGGDGAVYFGAGRDMTATQTLSEDWGHRLGHEHIVRTMWSDIEASYVDYSGGHIYRFDPRSWNRSRYHANREAIVEDLGSPVPGDGIYCMKMSQARQEIYGVTYPHGRFFVFDLMTRRASVVGDTWKTVVFAGPRAGLRSLPGDLAIDAQGRCLFTSDGGHIGFYAPGGERLTKTSERIPGEIHPIHQGQLPYHPVVESWVDAGGGTLYGGTNDGYLFRVDAGSLHVTNLGKPRITRRIRALATTADGQIYGVAGENKIGCTLFSYDPETGGYTHHGPLDVDETPYYSWKPRRFGASATGLDGTLYLGEEDRRGHLYMVVPILLPASR